jgi:hypothetical protein
MRVAAIWARGTDTVRVTHRMRHGTGIASGLGRLRARVTRVAWLAFGCLLGLGLAPLQTRAEPLRVLLLGAKDAELTARVHGQTRDLPLLLDVVDPGGRPDRERAEQLAREHAAQVVVWSEATGGASLRLYVLDLGSAQLRSRDVAARERETLAASTTAEMAALVVRSELSSTLAERDAAPAAAPPPPPPPLPPPAPPAAARPAPVPPPAPNPWLLAAGYRLSLPIKDELAHAAALALRRDVGRFALGVAGYAAGPLELERAGTQIRVRRFGLRLEALWGPQIAARTRLWLGLAGGCTGNARSTRSVGSEQQPTADELRWSGLLGPQAELHWQPLRYLGLSLALGFDFVLWRTKFAYEDAGGQATLEAFSRIEPWAMAGLFTRFGR